MSTPQHSEVKEPRRDDGEPLCPNCLAANPPELHFCDECNAPLSAHAAIDPLGSIYATGFVYQKAASRPHSRFVLIGMWLIFGPMILTNLPFIWISFLTLTDSVVRLRGIDTSARDVFGSLFVFLLAVGLEAVLVAILTRTTRNYLRDRPTGDGQKAESHS